MNTTAIRFLTILTLAVTLTLGSVVGASATSTPTLESRIHALGCEVGAAPGYGDRVVLLPSGDVERWGFRKLVRETVADRFFFMVGNCPAERSA